MATNLARSSQGKHLYAQGEVPVSLSDLIDEIIDVCLGNHGQLVNFGEAVWFSEIPPSREPTTSPFYCAPRVSFLPRRQAQFIVYQCIAQTGQGLQKQTPLLNESVCQRQNAGTKLKKTYSSRFLTGTDSATILVLLIHTPIIRPGTQVNVTRSGQNGLFCT